MKTLNHKKITPDEGYAAPANSGYAVDFFAKLPKNAVVDSIKVKGKHITDLGEPVLLSPCRECEDAAEMRVVATAYALDRENSKLFEDAVNYCLGDIEIFYHEEAVTEV